MLIRIDESFNRNVRAVSFVTVKPGVDGIKPENITVFDFLGESERNIFAMRKRQFRGFGGAKRFFRLTQWIETTDAGMVD